LIEPDGIDLFRARLLQLHVAHKWQWFIRVDPVDQDQIIQQPLGTQAALAALVSHRAGFAKVTTPPPEYADA
jgi:hypothetical protein